MKYIRTKDKIYDLSNKYSQTPEEVQIALMTGNYKQADKPEELCDLFIDEETKTIFHKLNGYLIDWRTNLVYSLKALVK